MFLKQRNPARQRRAPAVASGTPTCSSMTRHSSVQSATCLSIVTLPALGTTFLQRTAMLWALDGMGPATESRCHSNWGVRLTSCSFLNERDLTSKIVQCCTEVSFSNSWRPFGRMAWRSPSHLCRGAHQLPSTPLVFCKRATDWQHRTHRWIPLQQAREASFRRY